MKGLESILAMSTQKNNMTLTSFDKADITTLDYEAIKSSLALKLAEYDNFVYTEDNLAVARKDATYLNKQKKTLEDALKAYKKKCMEPYDEIAPKIKELSGMIEEQRQKIKEIDDKHKAKLAEEKKAEIKEYYKKKAILLGDLADEIYPKLFDEKWTNATTARKKYEEDIQIAINNAYSDIERIKSMDSPFVATLIEVYTQTLSMDLTQAKHAELIASAEKAGLTPKPPVKLPNVPVPVLKQEFTEEEGTVIKIYAKSNQMNQILDFMDAIGVKYEIQ